MQFYDDSDYKKMHSSQTVTAKKKKTAPSASSKAENITQIIVFHTALTGLRLCDQQKGRERRHLVRE